MPEATPDEPRPTLPPSPLHGQVEPRPAPTGTMDSGLPDGPPTALPKDPSALGDLAGPAQFQPSGAVAPGQRPEVDDSYPTRLSAAPFDMAAWADLSGWPTVPGYEILGLLGRGGMGVVYQARQVGLGRLVALKMILAGAYAGPDEVARFRREAEAAARLQHPHIVQIHDIGMHQGLPYFSLEYVEGGSLARKLAGTPLPPRPAAELVETLARAVEVAHRRGVVHRDLKPANVLLTADGTPKVADFGLAKRLDDPAGQTATGAILGTPSYMAPEQARGNNRQVGPAADVYALGAILYDLLTGRPPFKAATSMETVYQVLHEEPVPPCQLQPKLPRDLETICLKCLEKEPSHRYQTAAELADDLRRFLDDKPIQARRVSAPEALWRWCRRNRALAALTATVAGLLVAVAVGATIAAVYYLRVADREERLRNQAEQTAQREQELKTEAEDARSHAEASAAESRQRLVQQYVDKGIELVDAGDAFTALPWLAEALRLDPAGAEVHRTRLAAVLRQCPALVQILRHPSAISAAAYSPDGRLVATAGYEGTAQVWQAETGRPLNGPLQHGGHLSQLAFSPDGRWLATASGDLFGGRGQGEAKVWEVATGRLAAGPFRHARDISSVVFSPDSRRLLTASWDKTARVWEPDTGHVVPLKHATPVKHAAFSPDGHRVVTAGYDGTAQVFDAATGRPLASPLKHSSPFPLFDAAFSPDGRWLATAGGDNTARLWEAATGETHGQPMHQDGMVTVLAFSPDSQLLATAGSDGTARVWDTATGEPRTPTLRHAGWVTAVAFSPDGRMLLTASWDGTARLWDTATGEPLAPPLKHNSYVWTAAFDADGRHVLTASQDGVARLWDLTALGRGPLRPRPSVAGFSPQGERAVSAGAAPRVWDLTTGAPGAPLRGFRGSLPEACFSRDGRRLVTVLQRSTNSALTWGAGRAKKAGGSLLSALRGAITRWAETELQVWDAETGRPLGAPFLQDNYVYHVEFSPDGGRVVVVTGLFSGIPGGWEVLVWDAQTGRPVAGPLPHANLVMRAAFSADGGRLVTAGLDGVAHVWDLATGQEILPAMRAQGTVMGAEFSPDGRRLLVTSIGGGVQLFDVASGQPAAPPLEHLGVVSHATFSADGTRVVTTGEDGTARVWDAVTGEPLTPPLPHGERLLGAAFSPDGRRLVTVSKEITARVWDVATGQPLTPRTPQGDAVLRRALTPPAGNRPPRRFAITWEQAVRLWDLDLAAADGPPEDLVLRARLLASHALDAHGGLTPLSGDALRQAWEALRARHPSPAAPSVAEVLAWHRRAAEACAKGRLWQGALRHLDRLTKAEPKSSGHWLERGRAHAELAHWDQAAADYEHAIAAGATEEPVWRTLALLQLARGQPADYSRACAQLLDRFGQTNDPNTANNVAWACVLGPEATADPEQFVKLAKRAVQKNRSWVTLNTLGAAFYRAGRLDEAVLHLTEAESRHEKKGSALDQVFLALAHHSRGDDDRARACLAAADRLWKDESQAGLASPGWVFRLEFQLLRREVEAQLGKREGKPQPRTSAGEKDAHGR